MAKSNNNVITHGLSGKVGEIIVFSQRGGKTIISKAPKKRTGEPSPKAKAQQEKFQQAVIYGKSIINDPTKKEQYSVEGKSAFNVAVADLLNAPKIQEINLSAYHGNIGDIIVIRAYDDFKIISLVVSILNDDGSLVEQGNALNNNGPIWVYTATAKNDNLLGDKIIVRATDIPDNVSELSKDL